MTPELKIKHMILSKVAEWIEEEAPLFDEVHVSRLWEALELPWDAMNEIREGEVETDLPCDWSRSYESKAVAAKAADGSWVGWTYWYGGGKHGNPEEIDWMEFAYDLSCIEEEKVVTVRTFAVI